MNRLKHTQLWIVSLIFMLVGVACVEQTPIPIIITPTPDQTIAAATPVPTLEPTLTNTSEPTATMTDTQPPTLTPTATATPTTAVVQQNATSQVTGPIVGTEYREPTDEPSTAIPTIVIPTITNTPPAPTRSFTPGPSPTPLPGLDAGQMGLQLYSQVEYDDWTSIITVTERTGVGWIKVQASWAFLQPDGPNDWNAQMQLFERQMEAAARPGFNVLLSIAKAPAWARSVLDEDGPPDDPQLLADFITFMLSTKVGESIDAIEIWNEPNLAREWRGNLPFNGEGYMQLFRPAYDAVRAYSPTMTIVTAGLAPTGALADTVDDRDFLRQMYAAGLNNYTDVAVGVHPYGWGNPPDVRCCDQIPDRGWDDDPHFFFLDTIEEYRQIMVDNGHANIQMWATEFGWASWDGFGSEPPEPWMVYNSASAQANYAIRAFEIGQELSYMGPMFLWNLNFANQTLVEQRDERASYSIINPVLQPVERPLFNLLEQMAQARE